MAFQLSRFAWPFAFFLGLTVIIFLVFPTEVVSKTDKIYVYTTPQAPGHDEYQTHFSYTAILFEIALVAGLCYWYASQTDLPDTSIIRDFLSVLHDPNSRHIESQFGIYEPFQIEHDHTIGEWPQGTLGVGIVLNRRLNPVYMCYVANSDYETTQIRPRRETPIIAASIHVAHIEDAVRVLKPSLRATEEKLVENVFRRLKGATSEKKEYLKNRAEKALDADEGVETDE